MNEYRPDFAGFVMAPGKRQVSISELPALLNRLDANIIPVGVFVSQEPILLCRAVSAGIRVLQLHGDETPGYIKKLRKILDNSGTVPSGPPLKIWKAVRVSNDGASGPGGQNFSELYACYQGLIQGFVFDKYDPVAYGGTGQTLIGICSLHARHHCGKKRSDPTHPGRWLNGNNVREAVSKLSPFCVDVSSGVESDGKKDAVKVKNSFTRPAIWFKITTAFIRSAYHGIVFSYYTGF
jgi:phosphoribosylanthranilate isomerase